MLHSRERIHSIKKWSGSYAETDCGTSGLSSNKRHLFQRKHNYIKESYFRRPQLQVIRHPDAAASDIHTLWAAFFTPTRRSCERVEGPRYPPLGTVVTTHRQQADQKKKIPLPLSVTFGHVTAPRKTMCVGETTTRPRPHFLESGSKVDGWAERRCLFQCAATE